MVDGGVTMDGLKAKPGGAPVSTAPFPELVSDPAAMSWVEISPTKVLGRRRGRSCPRVVCHGESRCR